MNGQRRENEFKALKILKRYFDEKKYQDLQVQDKPDLQNLDMNFGVEVVTACNQDMAQLAGSIHSQIINETSTHSTPKFTQEKLAKIVNEINSREEEQKEENPTFTRNNNCKTTKSSEISNKALESAFWDISTGVRRDKEKNKTLILKNGEDTLGYVTPMKLLFIKSLKAILKVVKKKQKLFPTYAAKYLNMEMHLFIFAQIDCFSIGDFIKNLEYILPKYSKKHHSGIHYSQIYIYKCFSDEEVLLLCNVTNRTVGRISPPK